MKKTSLVLLAMAILLGLLTLTGCGTDKKEEALPVRTEVKLIPDPGDWMRLKEFPIHKGKLKPEFVEAKKLHKDIVKEPFDAAIFDGTFNKDGTPHLCPRPVEKNTVVWVDDRSVPRYIVDCGNRLVFPVREIKIITPAPESPAPVPVGGCTPVRGPSMPFPWWLLLPLLFLLLIPFLIRRERRRTARGFSGHRGPITWTGPTDAQGRPIIPAAEPIIVGAPISTGGGAPVSMGSGGSEAISGVTTAAGVKTETVAPEAETAAVKSTGPAGTNWTLTASKEGSKIRVEADGFDSVSVRNADGKIFAEGMLTPVSPAKPKRK